VNESIEEERASMHEARRKREGGRKNEYMHECKGA
jgi:hypothetical protein